MKGFIIYNPSFYSDAVKSQTAALKEEFAELKAEVSVLSGDAFLTGVGDGKAFTTLENADFIVYLSKDVLTAKILEKSGYKLFNSPSAIEICDDKAFTYSVLEENGVPIMDTLFAPRRYFGEDGEDYIKKVEEKFGYPVVVKLCVGSLGKEVFIATEKNDLLSIKKEIGDKPHLYQKRYGESGRDLRVIVIGGKAVASMERVNENDFRSNVELGGKGYKHILSEKEKSVAESAAAAVKADYCGVDLLTENGEVKVCEVNSNAFFKEISKVSCENIAKIYAKYIFERVKASK